MILPLRFSLATRCLNRTLKASVALAGEIGVTGIQLDVRNEVKPTEMSATGRRQFLHLLNEHGLRVASLDFPSKRALCDQDGLNARIERLKQAMRFAYQLEAATVTVQLRRLPDDKDEAGWALLKTVLNDLARHGNSVGVTVAVGAGRDSDGRLARMLNEVSEGLVGINFDPTKFIGAGPSPVDLLRSLGASIAHVVICDSTAGPDGFGIEAPVGRGDVPWDELLTALREMDYTNWLTVDRIQGDDRAAAAASTIEFLNAISLQ
jgi:sugar phosphate isomerase/epimerase